MQRASKLVDLLSDVLAELVEGEAVQLLDLGALLLFVVGDIAGEHWLFAADAKLVVFGNALSGEDGRLVRTLLLWLDVPALVHRAGRFAAISRCIERLGDTVGPLIPVGAQRHVDEGTSGLSPLLSGGECLLGVSGDLLLVGRAWVEDGVSAYLSEAFREVIVLPDGSNILEDEACVHAVDGATADDWLAR
jgi:hypothetical protein